MSMTISGVDYEDGRVTGVTISGIIEAEHDEQDTAYFRREVHGRWEETSWVEFDEHGIEIIKTPKAALRCSECCNCFKKNCCGKTTTAQTAVR